MVHRATSLSDQRGTSERGRLLAQAFAAARDEAGVPQGFSAEVLAEVTDAVASARLPERDETAVGFVTIDPEGSMDLDQALHIERDGAGYRVRYAIADVPAFLTAGGALDGEVHRRGQTVYCPDTRVPLHPAPLSEDAASLLPDRVRPAYVWDLRLTGDGLRGRAEVYRAMVRSRRRYDYTETQRLIDDGTGEATLLLLREVGELRIGRETERGGASLPMPQQEVQVGPDGEYHLRLRPLVPAEDWNAQVSLLTGMVAARMMLEAGVGILRTMPTPDEGALARFRREARGLGVPWPEGQSYGEYLRALDKTDPVHLAVVNAATSLFRGASYRAFDGDLPTEEDRVQAALASPYAHVTAPLRRLVDRYGLAVCEAVSAGREVPGWVREALPELPATMRAGDQRARAVDRACIAAVEAAVLVDRVGDRLPGIVVDRLPRGDVVVQLHDPPVSEVAEGSAELGAEVDVEVLEADIAQRRVRLRVVGPGEGR